jgi:hypothetical protein
MILLGSETYEVAVVCSACKHTDVMYVPLDETTEVTRFLIGRGWRRHSSGAAWFCPKERKTS